MTDTIDVFLAAAQTSPEAIAVAPACSYASLHRLVRQYAHGFAQTPGAKVLIALPRGVHAYAAMLGAGLAGGFYAPANEASPPEKLLRIALLLQPDWIVAPLAIAQTLAGAAPAARHLDPATAEKFSPLEGGGTRHRIAYVIFTSGSTGLPKGVVVPRTALNHYVSWIFATGCIRPDDRVSQFNNLAFDVSVFDVFGALCRGATLVPMTGKFDRLMPARAIAREKITVWTSVPSAIDLMITAGQLTQENLRTVRLFTLAGEALLRPLLEKLFDACPHATVQNAYGPTEATVTVTSMMMTADNFEQSCERSAVSIGQAIPGMTLHLHGGPHADEGELVIIGPQLAEGYWQDEARSFSAFRPLEIGGDIFRGYFTGDWVERVSKNLFFRERIDAQVKILGYRIELDEVAGAIRACGLANACVFKRGEALAALVECPPATQFDASALRADLARHIEPYAIPAQLCAVDRLPRNENDKIDRAASITLFEKCMEEAETR